jgi:hypothetical protein
MVLQLVNISTAGTKRQQQLLHEITAFSVHMLNFS